MKRILISAKLVLLLTQSTIDMAQQPPLTTHAHYGTVGSNFSAIAPLVLSSSSANASTPSLHSNTAPTELTPSSLADTPGVLHAHLSTPASHQDLNTSEPDLNEKDERAVYEKLFPEDAAISAATMAATAVAASNPSPALSAIAAAIVNSTSSSSATPSATSSSSSALAMPAATMSASEAGIGQYLTTHTPAYYGTVGNFSAIAPASSSYLPPIPPVSSSSANAWNSYIPIPNFSLHQNTASTELTPSSMAAASNPSRALSAIAAAALPNSAPSSSSATPSATSSSSSALAMTAATASASGFGIGQVSQNLGAQSHTCTLCDKDYPYPSALQRHLKSISHQRNVADQCAVAALANSISSSSATASATSSSSSASAMAAATASASVAGTGIGQAEGEDKGNLKKSGKSRVCTVCKKNFSKQSNLTQHMRIHTGEKPFACQYCHKKFAQYGNCQRHELAHTGEKPHGCTLCNKFYTQSDSLQRHLNSKSHQKKIAAQSLSASAAAVLANSASSSSAATPSATSSSSSASAMPTAPASVSGVGAGSKEEAEKTTHDKKRPARAQDGRKANKRRKLDSADSSSLNEPELSNE